MDRDESRPMARSVPAIPEDLSLVKRVRELQAQGVLGRPPKNQPLPPPSQVPDGLAQRMLAEDRGSLTQGTSPLS
jgi:hypothetical protein